MGKWAIFLSCLFLIAQPGKAQEVEVTSIHPKGHYPEEKNIRPMNFPQVSLEDSVVAQRINEQLVQNFLDLDSTFANTQQALNEWYENKDFLDYEITYNQQGLFSIILSAEGCGCYCSSWSEPYVFSTGTGEQVELHQIMDTNEFYPHLNDLVDRRYTFARMTLKLYLTDTLVGMDSSDYNWVLRSYESCEEYFNTDRFILYPDRLEVYAPCDMPHAIRSYGPLVDLSFGSYELSPYLKYRTGPDSPLFILSEP